MRKVTRILKFAAIAVLIAALLGFIVMRLWNWLTPPLFGWHLITFWQALGILILSKILFGGFRRPGPPGFVRARMMERWARMTPEEREKWRQSVRGHCGPFSAPPAETKS
jgi:hypothetical protein